MTFEPGPTNRSDQTLSTEDRNWAAGAHLSGFLAAYVALGIIGPTAVYFLKGSSSPFVRAHAVEAINFNITALIGIFVGGVLVVVGIGFIVLAVIAVIYLVSTILGAMAAQRGELYRYPLTFRFMS